MTVRVEDHREGAPPPGSAPIVAPPPGPAPVGSPRPRVGAGDRVTGAPIYADDLRLPRTLHCRLVRSTHAHAELVRIDASAARAVPGVHLVLTGEDLPTPYGILPVSQDETALAVDKVRHVGEPVAAVVARDEDTSALAAARVVVEYRALPVIGSPEQALAPGAAPIHPGGNAHRTVSLEFGDVEAGFAAADRVFEDLFHYGGNTHLAMEEHASLASCGPDGRLTLWSDTQVPHYLHRVLAKVLGMPPSRIRVVATPNGGGFGARSDVMAHEIVVAHASRVLGRPVRIGLSREEVFTCHRGRHPVTMRLRTGVRADGTITAMHLQSVADGGAYGSFGAASIHYMGAFQPVTYRIPAYRYQGVRAFTNKPPCGPKRGHGTPQPRFAQEVQLDRIAGALGIDAADLRLRICEGAGAVTANHLRVGSHGLAECIQTVVERSGWRDKRGRLPHGRGIGLACGTYQSGAGLPIYFNELPHSGVQLRLDRSGLVTAYSGATEIGQGSDDVLAACVAGVLGIDVADVRVVTGDTDLGPVDLGTYSSRVSLMMGHAAVEAAEKARDLLARAVAERLAVPADRLVFGGGRVRDLEDPSREVSFRDAVWLAEARFGSLGTTGSYAPPRRDRPFKGGGVGPSPAYSFTAAAVEVDVCPHTGHVRVDKVWIAHDLGRALNPLLARGQVEGCVYMGLGEALMEEDVFRDPPRDHPGGLVHRSPSMLDYKSPTVWEMPEVDVVLVEHPDPAGPFGAKEVGQGPMLPVPPAVANAVHDAIGVWVDEIPVSADRVLKALASRERGSAPRVGPKRLPTERFPEPLRVPLPMDHPERTGAAGGGAEGRQGKGGGRC